MRRDAFLAGGASVLGTLASAKSAEPATAGPALLATAATVTTQLLWIKNVEYAGFWIADAKGYYRRENITPAFLAGGPNLASVEAIVASGRADVGIDEFEKVVLANVQGAGFVAFGAVYQRPAGGLLSLPKNPIRSARDIVGKRIGLQQGTKQYIDAILTINKLPLEYTEVPVGFDPQPLVEGACDGYMCYITAQPLVLAAKHVPYVVTPFADFHYLGYSSALFATRDYVRHQRDVLVRYLRATIAGWEANRRDPALGAALTVDTYGAALGLDRARELAQNRAQIPLTQGGAAASHGGFLAIDPHFVAERVYATLRAQGLRDLPPVASLVDPTLRRDAAANGR